MGDPHDGGSNPERFRRSADGARRALLTGLGLYGLALVFRLAGLWAAFDPELRFDKFFVLARQLIADGWAPAGPHSYAPLYVYFVASGLALGLGPTAIAAVQAVLGSLVAPLVWAFARRVVGGPAAAVAGIAAALYGPFLAHDLGFESDGLGLVLFCAFAATLASAVERPRPAAFALAGLLLGVRLTVRPDAVLALPLLAVASWALARPRWTLGEVATRWGLVAAFAALPVLPLTWHNWRATGELIPVTDTGGYNLYVSNGPEATGLGYYPPGLATEMMTQPPAPAPPSVDRMDAAVARRLADLVEGESLSPRQASAFWTREGLRVIRERGLGQAALEGRKLLYAFHRFEADDNLSTVILEHRLGALAALGMGFAAPLGLVGLGMLAAGRRRHGWLVVALIAFPVAKLLLFHVAARYRLELAALLLPPAATCVCHLVALVREGSRRRAAGVALGVVLLALPLNLEWGYLAAQTAYRRILVATHLAERAPAPRVAVAELRTAVELATTPAQVEPALRRLARLYLELGNPAEAERCRRLAEGHLTRELEAELEARGDDPDALYALARHHTLAGRHRLAEEAFERALAIDPLHPVLQYGFAIARLRTGSAPPAAVYGDLERALTGDLKLWREGIRARQLLAEHLAATGRAADARRLLDAARRIEAAVPAAG